MVRLYEVVLHKLLNCLHGWQDITAFPVIILENASQFSVEELLYLKKTNLRKKLYKSVLVKILFHMSYFLNNNSNKISVYAGVQVKLIKFKCSINCTNCFGHGDIQWTFVN